MWTCPVCGRIFERKGQSHSCKKVELESHFSGKDEANALFNRLVEKISVEIGSVQIISIPCCVHLFGTYDFLAALPKKDRLEVRFALMRRFEHARITACVPISVSAYKYSLDLMGITDLDAELMAWLTEAYHLKDN